MRISAKERITMTITSTWLQEEQSLEDATAVLMVSDMIRAMYLPQRVFNATAGNARLTACLVTTTALHEVEPIYSCLTFDTWQVDMYKPTAVLYIYSAPTMPRTLTRDVERLPSTFIDVTNKLRDEDFMRTTRDYIKGWADGISLTH